MKKKLIGLAAAVIITFSSCSIFVRTKHHEAGVGISSTSHPDSSKTTETQNAVVK